jgi:hypothetical protein
MAKAKAGIEAYGNKGFKNLPWRKTFKSVDALNAWVEKNDASVLGTREVSAEEMAASR